jgi:octaprenyl-diphosphate synthase
MSLDYTSRLQKIEAVLLAALPHPPDSAWFRRNFFGRECEFPLPAAKAHFAEKLLEPGVDLLSRGGKRWRPLLMQLVCEGLGGGEAALPLAPLVEFCHNASLIHDDIEDNSEERRGKPAVHLLYGTDTAINSGCFMYFLPLSCIDGWDAPAQAKLELYSLWAREMRSLHLGQSLDIAWHRTWDSLPSIDDYYTMCALKTGVLARFAVKTGRLVYKARFADSPGGDNEDGSAFSLAKAAEKLGVGFQILDDVKNLLEGAPGKRRGDDVVEGKKSLPVLLYLHASDTAETDRRHSLVMRCFAAAGNAAAPDQAAAVEELIAALASAGAIDRAAEQGRSLLAEAEAAFSTFAASRGGAGEEARELLAGFTSMLG